VDWNLIILFSRLKLNDKK